ncbi:Tripartite tricarboxylate transporter TctA family protein [Kytococcus aerolatus]|uniref:Tripartite tricarboxylate transporter TctA family protein n=1 Tax=Kytococcus aerolatus TaxID=592308 RepID=A0A212U284_9MICO|nr:Tripartite tricarboxylate transporter TctA family protein [Kytococcus aerolatus]
MTSSFEQAQAYTVGTGGLPFPLPDEVTVQEVGPRDGLQLERAPIPTPAKVDLGGTIAVIGLVFLSPVLVEVSTAFGATEYAVLLLGALLLTSTLMTGSRIKAMVAVLFGMVLGIIGLDPQDNVERWTLGSLELSDGINIAIIAMALFAVPEALRHLATRRRTPPDMLRTQRAWMSGEDIRRSAGPYARGSVIGFIAGLLPGLGPTLGAFSSYAVEKRVASPDRRRHFGKGAIEGVAGPESANNAGVGGAMVPMLALAIPGSATTALLLYVFQMYGLQPGPQLFDRSPDLVWTIIASMLVGNAMLLVLNLPMVRIFVQLLRVPPPLLYAGVLAFTFLGAYALTFSLFSLLLLLGIGLVGFFLQENGFPLTPAILAAVLVPMRRGGRPRPGVAPPSCVWAAPPGAERRAARGRLPQTRTPTTSRTTRSTPRPLRSKRVTGRSAQRGAKPPRSAPAGSCGSGRSPACWFSNSSLASTTSRIHHA